MARRINKGLEYLPLDLNFFQDRKVRRLQRKCDADAPMVYIALLCTIYREGYYVKWDEDFALDLADSIHKDEDYVNRVILACFEVGLLSEEIFAEHRILTSSGIQKQYNLIGEKSKRKSRVEEYSLLDYSGEMEDKSELMPDYSEEMPINSVRMQQSKVKESKVKKSKVNSSSLPSSSEELSERQKEEEKFISYFTFTRNYCAPRYEYERMVAYNSTSGKKKWEDLSESEKAAVGALWHPEGESANEHKIRFPADFLKTWDSFYKMLIQAGAPYDVRMAALDDNLKIVKDSGGVARLHCPKILYDWIEKPPNGKDNMEKVKPILLPYLNSNGYTTLKYQFI